ncbi:MAG: Ig-like domain-containing protein [Spirochaetaceae bacterium]
MKVPKRLLWNFVSAMLLQAVFGCRLFPMAPLEVVRVWLDSPQRISVEFSAPPDPARFEAAVLLQKNDRTVHGRVSVEGVAAHFYPDEPVDRRHPYRFTVSTVAEDMHGNTLRRPLAHEFGPQPDDSPLRVAAAATRPHTVTLSFSEAVAPDALYGHLQIAPDRRYRIEFADRGRTAHVVFLSPDAPENEHSLRVMQGLTGARGGVLPAAFEYRSPEIDVTESTQEVTLHFHEPGFDTTSITPVAGYTEPDLLPTYEHYGRSTTVEIEFAEAVRAADVEQAIRISPEVPVTITTGAGTHVHEARVDLGGPLDAGTLYRIEIGTRVRDREGRFLPHVLFAGIKPLEHEFQPLQVEEIRFDGEVLVDGGTLDLGGFVPHTDIQFAEIEIALAHGAGATVSSVDVARAFRIYAWANSARFRLISLTRTTESQTETRFRLRLEVTDEAGRFGIVSVYLLQELTDSLGNELEQDWRVDLNQIGGPKP